MFWRTFLRYFSIETFNTLFRAAKLDKISLLLKKFLIYSFLNFMQPEQAGR